MLEAQYFQEIEWKQQNDHQKEAACCSFGESFQGLYELDCFNRVMPWSIHGPWFVFVRFQAIGVKGMTRGNRDLITRVSIGSCSKLW